MIIYTKFFKLSEERQLTIADLRKILSPRTVYRLEMGEEISVKVIDKICREFNCQPADIMEYVSEN